MSVPRHITIDLDRLRDASYMEAMTGTDAWARLEEYFRDTMVVNLLEQIRGLDIPMDTKEKMVTAMMQDLSDEDRGRISAMLKVSDLLDTLIDARPSTN
jgi:hypothetical protein